MPDPLKSGEIEDVLSSIRRLVADEVSVRGGVSVSNATSTLRNSDKLLLTSALRVAQTDGAQGDSQHEDALRTDEAQADTPKDDAPQDDKVRADAPQDGIVTPGLAEHESAAEVVAPVESDADPDLMPTSEPEPARAGEGFGALSEPAENDPLHAAVDGWEEVSLETRIADLEAAVADSEEDWEPDGSEIEQTPVDLGFAAMMPDADPVAEGQAEQVAQSAARADDPADGDPSGGGEDPANMFEGDPDILDEEMLRQLVTDIVREELQGSLGERITRNVRKLVRREINNALAARDFD